MNQGQRPNLLNGILSFLASLFTISFIPALVFLLQSDEGNKGESDDDDDSGKGTGEQEDDEDEDDDDDDSGDSGKSAETIAKEEYDKVVKRMKAADKRASEAEKAVKDKEKKEQSELEQAKTELEDAKKEKSTLSGQLQELQAEVAFLKQDKYKFQDPRAALRLAKDYFDDNKDDDGEVDMDAVLKQVAKDYPVLLKKDEKEEDNDDPSSKKSGSSTNKTKGNGKKTDEQRLRKKYSALRR